MTFDTAFSFPVETQKKVVRVVIALVFFTGIGCVACGVWFYTGSTQAYGTSQQDVVVCDSSQLTEQEADDAVGATIVVAVSGAVKSPGMYEMKPGGRVGDLVAAAGGFSSQADAVYVETALNLAREIHDGEGVYVPTKNDGDVLASCTELSGLLQAARAPAAASNTPSSVASKTDGISINTATLAELDTLPGIGAKRAEAIIAGRPYSSVKELVEKKILTESIFVGLEEMIQL